LPRVERADGFPMSARLQYAARHVYVKNGRFDPTKADEQEGIGRTQRAAGRTVRPVVGESTQKLQRA